MNEDKQQLTIPPCSLYTAINALVAVLYAFILPVTVTLLLRLPVWAVVLICISWPVVNLRIVDRYIPVVTDPFIRWIWKLHEYRKQRN